MALKETSCAIKGKAAVHWLHIFRPADSGFSLFGYFLKEFILSIGMPRATKMSFISMNHYIMFPPYQLQARTTNLPNMKVLYAKRPTPD